MDYITGSHGFLGTHLIASLKSEFVSIPHEQISTFQLKEFNNFYFLSSYGNIWGQDNIDSIIQANVIDLLHILQQASKFQFNSFVFMSTSSVKLEYQTPYSRMKKAAEEILLTYMEKLKLPICIIRPMSITGVGEQSQHLIPTLIRSCMSDKLINFVPNPTHDYIDVDDVVGAILHLSERSSHGIFEVGSGKSYANREVLDIVEKVIGKKANINLVESMRPYDNKNWISNNFSARRWGWLPKISLNESIRRMVEAYDK